MVFRTVFQTVFRARKTLVSASEKERQEPVIYTPLTRKAMEIAYNAHHGQRDKSGVPYIFHPAHLAEQMTDETTTCVALLHDVVEDTDMTIEELAEEFPDEVIRALRLLTHDPEVDYFDYVRAVKADPAARMVKLADLEHNADETRVEGNPSVSEEQRLRRREKYRKAKEILLERR